MGERPKVAVIGGGAAGLFAALRLQEHGIQPVVLEAGKRAGGLMAGFRAGSQDLEHYYHHLFLTDALLLDTAKTLGLPIDWGTTRTGFIAAGSTHIHEMSAPQHIFRFRLLSRRQRIRLVGFLGYLAAWDRFNDVRDLDDIPVLDWLKAHGAGDLIGPFFEPMIRKKYGCFTPDVSAAWLIGRLTMRAGRSTKGEHLGYPRGGYAALAKAMAKRIEDQGGEIRLQTPAVQLTRSGGSVRGVTLTDGDLPVDAVVATAPPRPMARILEKSGLPDEARCFEKLPYQGAIVVVLGLEKTLGDFYWTNTLDPALPFGSVIEHTNLVKEVDYDGHVVYLASYPDPDDPIWDASDDGVIATYLTGLTEAFPTMAGNTTRWVRVFRAKEASLIYNTGLLPHLPPPRSPGLTGLHYTGMFRCYPRRPIDLVGAEACATADRVAADLLGKPEPSGLPTRLSL